MVKIEMLRDYEDLKTGDILDIELIRGIDKPKDISEYEYLEYVATKDGKKHIIQCPMVETNLLRIVK